MDDRIVVWLATHRVAVLNDPLVWLGTIEKLGAVWIVLALESGVVRRRGSLGHARPGRPHGDDDVRRRRARVRRQGPDEPHPALRGASADPPALCRPFELVPGRACGDGVRGRRAASFAAPRSRRLFLVLAALIGFSRVYDGVHYPTDVLAGAALGAVVGAVAAGCFGLPGPRWRGGPTVGRRARRRNVRSAA